MPRARGRAGSDDQLLVQNAVRVRRVRRQIRASGAASVDASSGPRIPYAVLHASSPPPAPRPRRWSEATTQRAEPAYGSVATGSVQMPAESGGGTARTVRRGAPQPAVDIGPFLVSGETGTYGVLHDFIVSHDGQLRSLADASESVHLVGYLYRPECAALADPAHAQRAKIDICGPRALYLDPTCGDVWVQTDSLACVAAAPSRARARR